jgi:hypothetical protein
LLRVQDLGSAFSVQGFRAKDLKVRLKGKGLAVEGVDCGELRF